jgi:hypothetical protein
MRTTFLVCLFASQGACHFSATYPPAAAPTSLVYGYGPGYQMYQQRQAAKAGQPVVTPTAKRPR